MFNELREALQKFLDDGISKPAAIEFVADAAEKDKSTRRKTIKEAVDIAVQHTVSGAIKDHRRNICRRAEAIQQARIDGSEKIRAKVAGLMGFRLPSGTPLGEATGTDCQEAANLYMQTSKVHYHRASFLANIANRVGDSVVSDVMDEDALQTTYEGARRLP